MNKDKQAPETAQQPSEHQARQAIESPSDEGASSVKPDPTRYGDWEKNGRCIDFATPSHSSME